MFDFLPDQILSGLQWLFPYGLGGAITWLISGRIRKARVDKEQHDIYKEMFDGLRDEMKQTTEAYAEMATQNADNIKQNAALIKQNAELQHRCDLLLQALYASRQCSNVANCRVMQMAQKIAPSLLQKPKGRHRPRDIDMDATKEGSTLCDHPP